MKPVSKYFSSSVFGDTCSLINNCLCEVCLCFNFSEVNLLLYEDMCVYVCMSAHTHYEKKRNIFIWLITERVFRDHYIELLLVYVSPQIDIVILKAWFTISSTSITYVSI